MIDDYGFGRIRINGRTYTDDVKLLGRDVIPDWWRAKGHTVSPEDVADLLAEDVEVLVIGKGRPGMMRTDAALRRVLEERGIRLVEVATAKAVREYERLLERGLRVAAGLHLTC